MKPGNQYIFIYMVLNPAVYLLKDKYKFAIKTWVYTQVFLFYMDGISSNGGATEIFILLQI